MIVASGPVVLSRLTKGLASSVLGQAISAVQAVALVPLFLGAWGPDGYGTWLAVTSFVSYLVLLDLGGQNHIGNLLASAYARGDEQEFTETLSEGVSLFIGLSAVAFVLLGGALVVVPSALVGHEAKTILLVMAAAFLLSIPGGVYVSAYRASGLFTRGTMIGNAIRLSILVVLATLLFFRVPPVGFAVAFLALGVGGTAIIVVDTRRAIPACRDIRVGIGPALRGRRYLGGALHFWLLAVAQTLNAQGVLLVLAALASPTVVALYATHRTIAGFVGTPGSLLQAPLWPELTFLTAQGRRDELVRAALLSIKVVTLVAGVAALFLWIVGPLAYSAWTRRELVLDPWLLGILLVQGVLNAAWATAAWSLLAASRHQRLALWSLLNSLITIGAAMLLAGRWGAVGVASASVLGDLLCGVVAFPLLFATSLRLPVSRVYEAAGLPILALLPLAAVTAYASSIQTEGLGPAIFAVTLAVWVYPAFRLVFGGRDAAAVTRLVAPAFRRWAS